jgi:hypothetical protein
MFLSQVHTDEDKNMSFHLTQHFPSNTNMPHQVLLSGLVSISQIADTTNFITNILSIASYLSFVIFRKRMDPHYLLTQALTYE